MNNNLFNNPEGQLVISYELICLLEWLITNHSKDLQTLIDSSIENGLTQTITYKEDKEQSLDYDPHETILEFFNLLQNGLYIATTNQLAKKTKEQNLLPKLKHIDTSVCDSETMQLILEKTTKVCEQNPEIDPKHVLFKELLKNWEPEKKEVTN